MSEEALLQVSIDGDHVKHGEIDLRSLTDVLSAISEILRASDACLNPGAVRMSIAITTAESGSYQFGLKIKGTLRTVARTLLEEFDDKQFTPKELVLFLFNQGVVYLLRKMNGEEPKKLRNLDSKQVEITTCNGEVLEVSPEVALLLTDEKTRKSFKSFSENYGKHNLKEVVFTPNGEEPEVIDVDTAECLDYRQVQEAKNEEVTATVNILALRFFDDKGKWYFKGTLGKFSAHMEDRNFLHQVHNNEISFSEGDALECVIKCVTDTESGAKTEYFISEVLKHHPAMKVQKFNFEDE